MVARTNGIALEASTEHWRVSGGWEHLRAGKARRLVLESKPDPPAELRTALTRMPRGPSSTASAFVSVLRPPFDVAYLRRGTGEHQQWRRSDAAANRLLCVRHEARFGQVGVN